jgi:hypothetical protein
MQYIFFWSSRQITYYKILLNQIEKEYRFNWRKEGKNINDSIGIEIQA